MRRQHRRLRWARARLAAFRRRRDDGGQAAGLRPRTRTGGHLEDRRRVALIAFPGNDGGVTDAESPAIPALPALPAVPASAGALIFDGTARLLILKPTYKTGWTIPGGVMEADGETPWDA